jgi:hypothetical protein
MPCVEDLGTGQIRGSACPGAGGVGQDSSRKLQLGSLPVDSPQPPPHAEVGSRLMGRGCLRKYSKGEAGSRPLDRASRWG